MIYYRISPETSDPNGKPLFLTAQQSTRTVAVATLLPNNDPSQLWTPVEYIWGTDQGFVLLNYQTNMVISAPNDNAAVALTNHIDMNRGTWKFQGVNYGALQLQANTDMNLMWPEMARIHRVRQSWHGIGATALPMRFGTSRWSAARSLECITSALIQST